MKKLTGKLWAKAVAFLLFCLLVPAAVGSGLGLYYGYEENWYSGKAVSFTDTDWCRSCVYDNLNRISGLVWNEGIDSTIDLLTDQPELLAEGFSYIIRAEDESLITDTTAEEAVYIASVTAEEAPPEEDDGFDSTETGDLYTVDGYVTLPVDSGEFHTASVLYNWIYGWKDEFLPVCIGSSLLLVVLFVFLMAAAGHKDGEDGVVLRGHNKIPLDFYTGLCFFFGACVYWTADDLFWSYNTRILFEFAGAAVGLIGWSVICLSFCITVSARLKAGKWWQNTIFYYVLRLFFRAVSGFFKALPLVWKTAAASAVFLLVSTIFAGAAFSYGSFFFLFLLLMLDFAAFCALIGTALQLRLLQKAGTALADGNLEYKVDPTKLWLDFKTHGRNLNSISLGMSKAVDERLRSERFKTELITNVSHDLKTPLTSIVSYIDLLKKEDIQNENALEYIDVLDRQSAKLKKLTEDLVEASKASSGAIAVNKENLDLAELVGQSVGEYAEKFAAANLEPVVALPEEETTVSADGRLLWRVLDNLMQNIVKYALPGTRIYVDLKKSYGKAVLTLKNISREPLNIPADELMERFIRGDSSRSTEGSGLGLSIAKSLAEQMGGTLNLYLDGDLFKVVLIFNLEQE